MLEGTRAILAQAGCPPGAVDLVVHGTTLATNALIERKGARTALVTTEGFRDFRRDRLGAPLRAVRPVDGASGAAGAAPLASRRAGARRGRWRGAAAAGRGRAARPRPRGCARTASRRSPSASCTALPTRRMSAAPARSSPRELPGVAVSLSCEVAPEIREYERASTTVANAYVLPLMEPLPRPAGGRAARSRASPRRCC